MLKIGSISTNEDGTKTIYVDYNDKTKTINRSSIRLAFYE